ncbi:GNAT family N-acetyltransferase [Staphylococcus ratti]|uniref:GNAT family N-acetyltransferase n=1 Tax=Staphylococcus ratti TaxID=2892440 RepID=A0ABY3PDR8_9STAP|nr:GNAT family N-acetyltransferase [Staphylococcus ratti]UEX90388.1 GNAT family N-acetyltransferase [Staphylococcus ratti]
MEIMKSDNMSGNEEILTLLLQANPDKEKVMCDYHTSEHYVLKDNEAIKEVLLLKARSPKEVEVLNISIKSKYQNQGLGKILMKHIFNILKKRNYEKVTLGTGNSSINQLAFYQKLFC